MKGIVLAGESGLGLRPVTEVVSKHLLPIYDKPMVYYPLSTLMLAGVRDILLLTAGEDLPAYERLLGNGAQLGIRITCKARGKNARGSLEAFLEAKAFLGDSEVALIAGDNLLCGSGLGDILQQARERNPGATVFGYGVKDPERYPTAVLDAMGGVTDIDENPTPHRSDVAVTGLAFYTNDVMPLAQSLQESAGDGRELAMSDLNRAYLRRGRLRLVRLSRGIAWLDAATPDALLEAANLIALLERRQGTRIACLEEVAYRMGFIDADALAKLAAEKPSQPDREYLQGIVET